MDKRTEEWRDIQGYEGIYQVSNFGRVKSLPRTVRTGLKYTDKCQLKERILKPCKTKLGYLSICLNANGKSKTHPIHRLVAWAFPEICGEYFEGAVINHKDENRANNNALNLEWCTQKYNNNYGHHSEKLKAIAKRKPVLQIKNGVVVKEWESLLAIRKAGMDIKHICNCCNNKKGCYMSYGYVWKYKQED